MTGVNMAGALPAGDSNGLGKILSKLIHSPDVVHIGVVLFDVSKLTTNTDTGDVTPTIRVRAVEPITQDRDAEEAQRLLRRAHEERTGQQQLPLDLEQAIDHWLLKVDTTTGVITGPDDPAGDTSEDGGGAQADPPTGPEPDAGGDVVVPDDVSELDDGEMPTGPEWGDREDGDHDDGGDQ